MGAGLVKIMVTGTRHATIADHGLAVQDHIFAAVADNDDQHKIYVGDAAGVDLIVRHIFAGLPGWAVREFEAHWDECDAQCPAGHRRPYRHGRGTYCPAAGMRRNREMVAAFVAAGGTCVLAFPAGNVRSSGTRGCLVEAKRAGLVVPPDHIIPLTVETPNRRAS